MPIRSLSLHVVGVAHPNRDGGNRRFEIMLCPPGEPVELRPEPKNPVDPAAVAVFSIRGVQIGYLTAERCGWIGGMIRDGREIDAVFQEASPIGAVIRVALDGEQPALPDRLERDAAPAPPDDDFWPDYEPPDEFD